MFDLSMLSPLAALMKGKNPLQAMTPLLGLGPQLFMQMNNKNKQTTTMSLADLMKQRQAGLGGIAGTDTNF